MRYTIHTAHDDTVILQELINEHQEKVARWIVSTREKGIREALIAMGWTPPENEQ